MRCPGMSGGPSVPWNQSPSLQPVWLSRSAALHPTLNKYTIHSGSVLLPMSSRSDALDFVLLSVYTADSFEVRTINTLMLGQSEESCTSCTIKAVAGRKRSGDSEGVVSEDNREILCLTCTVWFCSLKTLKYPDCVLNIFRYWERFGWAGRWYFYLKWTASAKCIIIGLYVADKHKVVHIFNVEGNWNGF